MTGVNPIPRATHHAPWRIGDRSINCAVLEDGRRGFIKSQMPMAIGMSKSGGNARFQRFLANFAPNALSQLANSWRPVLVRLPDGRLAEWVPYEFLSCAIKEIVRAYAEGRLTAQQVHIGRHCLALQEAYADVGLRALIDEATGYQYGRAPDALQELFQRLIADQARDWDRRFGPDFYTPVCRLFGISYAKQHRALPDCIGQFTRAFVYEAVFPPEIVGEITQRRGHTKLHQWLKDGGLRLLERQRDRVRDLACGSVDYRDFKDRYAAAFPGTGRQMPLVLPLGRAAS